ncbi:MAG: hypothetical protein COB16_16440 [Rhodobacteraceae bacterium]|nr:MAG: hypothetical protein COB16_16440 [Paracoccaceae bacterium]
MSGTMAVEIEVSETPDQISQRCSDLSDLLHFYLHVGEMVGYLRNRVCEGGDLDNPKLLYAQIAILDDAMNLHWGGKANQAMDFAETLGNAFFKETATYKEAVHVS